MIGARFHAALTRLIVDLADRFARDTAAVALSGGVFQNALLLLCASETLRNNGFQVLTHRQVPPNDGGIALGQLMVGSSG